MKKLYMILSLALILCIMVGCQDKEAMAEVEEQNKEIIRQYFEEIDKGNLAIIDEIFAPDVIYHYRNKTEKGVDSIMERYLRLDKDFTDLKHTIELQIAEGDMVATCYIGSRTYTGEPRDFMPTGEEISFMDIYIARIKDEKIVEAWKPFPF